MVSPSSASITRPSKRTEIGGPAGWMDGRVRRICAPWRQSRGPQPVGPHALKLRMQAKCEDRDRAALAVVGRIVNELVIAGHPGEAERGETIIGLDYLLRPGFGQLSIADNAAEAAGRQILLADMGDLVGHGGQSHGIVRTTPPGTSQRQTDLNG